jgi:hypothetical protein
MDVCFIKFGLNSNSGQVNQIHSLLSIGLTEFHPGSPLNLLPGNWILAKNPCCQRTRPLAWT